MNENVTEGGIPYVNVESCGLRISMDRVFVDRRETYHA